MKKEPAIKVMMMPKDTNSRGTIFGGVILSYIDQAGAVEAIKKGARRPVTVNMKEINFLKPVYVGDIVSFYTETLKIGTTSITVRVRVVAERIQNIGAELASEEKEKGVVKEYSIEEEVTEAVVTYVNIDHNWKPMPIKI
ncbi:MAG: hotdog domain-containing protein [Thermoanaerobaculia bacterium]